MKVTIKGKEVKLEDESGDITYMATDQLLEMVQVLNSTILDGDRFYFENLEFTV